MTYKTCFALQQIFVGLDGKLSPCCISQKALSSAEPNPFIAKKKINNAIVDEDDLSGCWQSCPAVYTVDERPVTDWVNKIVMFTNTFCPLTCNYCSLAYAADDPEWTDEHRPTGATNWDVKGADGKWSKPVRLPKNNTPNLLASVKRLAANRSRQDLAFEFSGGDAAYHPEFIETVEFLCENGIKAIYLSSGLPPAGVKKKILDLVRTGFLDISISVDAVQSATWAAIKRQPEALFHHVISFISDLSQARARGDQIWVKYILGNSNIQESGQIFDFFSQIGVDSFAVSEYRAQPVYFVDPPSEECVAAACSELKTKFWNLPKDKDYRLTIIGLERFFEGRSYFENYSTGVRY